MIDRFKGWPKIKVACAASLECQVGYHTCYAVLFQGKAIKSPATQRVLLWARREGYRIIAPAAKGGNSGEVNIPDGTNSTPGTAAALDAAERRVEDLSK